MGRKRNNGLSEEKQNIIGQLIELYDIKTAADIQTAFANDPKTDLPCPFGTGGRSSPPATCQGQAAEAVAAFAVICRARPPAPESIYTSQFARLQKILNSAQTVRLDIPPLF